MNIRYEDPKSRNCPYCNKKSMKPIGQYTLLEDAAVGSEAEVVREDYICLMCGLMLGFREVQKKIQDMQRSTESTQLRQLAMMRDNVFSTLTNKTFKLPGLSDRA